LLLAENVEIRQCDSERAAWWGVERKKHTQSIDNATGSGAERWRPITLDWKEDDAEGKAASERQRMVKYLEKIERRERGGVWVPSANGRCAVTRVCSMPC
jgi:hypothetical protein